MKKTKLLAALMLSLSLCIGIGFADEDTSGSGTPAPTPTPEWDRVSNYPEEDGSMRYWMEDLEDGTGSLTLDFFYNDDQQALDGAEISIVKVADLKVRNGNAKYLITDGLSEHFPGIKFDGMVSEDLMAFAKEAKGFITDYDKMAVSDKNGNVKFEGLEYGLYLVVETGKSGTAKGFADFTPFIVNIPYPVVDTEKYVGTWNYDVNVKPKTEFVKFTPTPTPPTPRVQTGDPSGSGVSIACLIGVLALALAGLVVSTGRREE